jgi:hypothetical protein
MTTQDIMAAIDQLGPVDLERVAHKVSKLRMRRPTGREAVEIKTFGGASLVADLQQAVGQFLMYKSILSQTEPDRKLYLAVSEEVRNTILSEDLGRLMLQEHIDHLFFFSVEREEIVSWTP